MAVVKYIGSTNFKSGIWVREYNHLQVYTMHCLKSSNPYAAQYGLCLDGPDGTHDGIVEGTRYFTCPANHGKMVQGRAIQSGLFGRVHAYKTCRETIALPFCARGLFGINSASFLREYVRVCAMQQGQFHVDHTLVHKHSGKDDFSKTRPRFLLQRRTKCMDRKRYWSLHVETVDSTGQTCPHLHEKRQQFQVMTSVYFNVDEQAWRDKCIGNLKPTFCCKEHVL